jgi:uncharacterized protein (DUF58 family)
VTTPQRVAISAEDLGRAARLLTLRSRREATGLFAGNYASAFRGGGVEFEESRPYVAGDDVTRLDWNATARTGEIFVKRFRAERNQTLLFALDTSASMGFGTTGVTKAATAAHALALLATAAARAGDRTGLLCCDDSPRAAVAVGRGGGHGLRVIHAAVERAADPRGATRLAEALRSLRMQTRRRAVMVLLSDFRDPQLFPPEPAPARLLLELAELAQRHDVIAAPVVDPAEEELPRVGALRIADPERAGAPQVLQTGRKAVRRRYRAAALAWRDRLERELRRSGAEIVWLRTDRSPLHALGRFFRERAGRRAAA